MPIPPMDCATPPLTGSGTPAKNSSQKRKRKRSSTGYQVGQATSAYKILPKHQQPPEQPLIPPIKLRRVYDDHRRVVSSFGEQSTQEPMATEPTITAHPEPLPVTVAGPQSENPQPTNGNITSTSETIPVPVRENIEPMEEDGLPAIPSEVLSMFMPKHQAALQEHLINENLETNQRLKMVVQNAERLLKTLRERKIELSKNRSKPPVPTLFAKLEAFSIIEKPELFSTYFAKATVFFSAVNTTQIKNTGCLSSMLYTKSQIKGFAKQSEEDIRAIVGQPFLKQISSMRNGKGFPTRAQMDVFIAIPCLKQGWQQGKDEKDEKDEAVQGNPVDQGLLIHISSMHNGRGFPTREQVEAFMTMPCLKKGWKQNSDEAVQDNPVDRELLMRIASMNNGKGFPSREQVAAFMTMPCLKEGWQQGNDEDVKDKPIDWELLMRAASMSHGKGFPTREQVAAFMTMPCLKEGWQRGSDEAVHGKPIDRKLLMRIASMSHGKGFPPREQVEAFMTIPCLKQGWKQGSDEAVQNEPIDRELLMRIASMNSGKGSPTKAQAEAFITMPCLKEGWKRGSDEAVQDHPIDRDLLMCVASINGGKGFPTEADVTVFVQWLPQNNKKHCLKMASRVFVSSGLPGQKVLTANERLLRQYLPEYSIDSDDDISDSDDEPGDERVAIDQMKVLALFCSAPGQWHMKIAEFEQFLTAHTSARNERTEFLSALTSLMPMLFNHGGAGVRFWLARHNENQHNSDLLTRALSIPARLDTVKFALTQLPESECLEYIELCRNLSPAPNNAQWDALKPLREQLGQRFTMAQSKALMLKILWSQPEAKHSVYGEKLDSLFNTVPTVRQLYRIHRAFGPQKMQDFLDACIAQTINANALKVKAQELLLEGLLLARHYLSDHGQIPDLCFSSQVASANGKGVMINGDAVMPGQQRLWHFIAGMLIELEQVPRYQFEKQRLTVLSGSGPFVLPKPEFSLVGNGFEITNWSLEQVRVFFQATEFTERLYKKPQDEREPNLIRRHERLAHRRARANETEKTGDKKATSPLAPSVILSVIKSGLTLKPVIWASLEHYAKNGQLTAGLCQALAPVIQQQEAVVPDIVKNAVTARLAEIDAQTNMENDVGEATITQPFSLINELIPAPPGSPMQRPQATFETALAALDRFEVLGETELEMLQPYRDQMAPGQLASVVDKMRQSVDVVTQLNWRTTYEKKIKDLLGLDELMSRSDNDQPDWLADIL